MPHGMKRTIAAVLFALLTLETQGVERIVYYHNDALGSPIAATDEQGNLLWRESYAPYGQRLLKQAGSQERLFYTGKAEEAAFGIQDFGARWYDPQTGRFLSIDPAGFDPQNLQSFNRYAYANNNPYGFVDPDGRAPKVPYQVNFDLGTGGGGSYGMGYGRTSRAQASPRTTGEGIAEAGGATAKAAHKDLEVYRQGTFANEAVGWEGNFVKGKQWANNNPLATPDYAKKYGLPAENTGKPDWIAKGRVQGDYTTRSAPASHNNPANSGGGNEILPSNPDNVRLNWFHMPD
ncbi:MAG: RHS repeat domain-containing protein [Gammaproteobacteria bacterium]